MLLVALGRLRRIGGVAHALSHDAPSQRHPELPPSGRTAGSSPRLRRRRAGIVEKGHSRLRPNADRDTGALGVDLTSVSRKGIGGSWRSLQQELCDLFGGLGEGQAFAGSVVEFVGDGVEFGHGDGGEVGAFGEVLA
jgi:hypothetical protein